MLNMCSVKPVLAHGPRTCVKCQCELQRYQNGCSGTFPLFISAHEGDVTLMATNLGGSSSHTFAIVLLSQMGPYFTTYSCKWELAEVAEVPVPLTVVVNSTELYSATFPNAQPGR